MRLDFQNICSKCGCPITRNAKKCVKCIGFEKRLSFNSKLEFEKISKRVYDGEPIEKIALEYGMRSQRLRKILKRDGFPHTKGEIIKKNIAMITQ